METDRFRNEFLFPTDRIRMMAAVYKESPVSGRTTSYLLVSYGYYLPSVSPGYFYSGYRYAEGHFFCSRKVHC